MFPINLLDLATVGLILSRRQDKQDKGRQTELINPLEDKILQIALNPVNKVSANEL